MEGIKRIKERILEEARGEARKITNEAEENARKITDQAGDEAEQKKEILLEKGKKEAETRKARLISMAELEMKKELLAIKQELMEEAFQKTMERLKNMDKREYEENLIKMILDAIKTGEEEIILSRFDHDKLSPDFLKRLNRLYFKKQRDRD